ncbi:MAG TPA: hypothetical protein VFZ83_00290 [Acidimicrobiia bacterium]|nr:hypothetical protein [Acidimicrobiia bacterium]
MDDASWASTLAGVRRRIAEDGARLRAAEPDPLPDIEPRGVSAALAPNLLALTEHEVGQARAAVIGSKRRAAGLRVAAAAFGLSVEESAVLVSAGATVQALHRATDTAITEITGALERLEVQVARLERRIGALEEAERERASRARSE